MIHEMTGKVFDKVKGVVAISIALAGMTLAGQAQAATNLTGDPIADGYTFLGNLNDPGKYVEKWGDGTSDTNGGVYTKSFILGAGDTAASVMGTFGDTTGSPMDLTSVTSNTMTTWQVGDEIFSMGIVNLGTVNPPTGQMLFMGFNSDGLSGVAGGHTSPEWAASTVDFPGVGDGNTDGGGTGPGDLVTFNVNGSTSTGFDLGQGYVLTKDTSNTAVQLGPGGGALDPYLFFFNGEQLASNNAYFTEGMFLINKSEVERDWLALGTDLTPEPFGDLVDFTLALFNDSTFANGSRGVFFDVSTVAGGDPGIPEPASLALLGLGGLLMLRRRRTA